MPAADTHDLVVMSDVHLHTGTPPGVVEALCRAFLCLSGGPLGLTARPSRVVLAGDFFDLSMVQEVPQPSEASFPVTPGERRFGLNADGEKTVWKIEHIFRKHRHLAPAMAGFVSRGNDLVFVPGNHDEELLLPEVQDHLRKRLETPNGPAEPAGAGNPESRGRLLFTPWFYYEPGFAYVEHGHFYDRDNAPPSPLRPCPLPPGSSATLPLGALVTRYLLSVLPGYDSRGDADRTPWPLLVKVIRRHGVRAPAIIYRYYAMAARVLRTALARSRGTPPPPAETPDRFAARAGVSPEQLVRLLPLVAHPTTRSLRSTVARLYLDRSAAFVLFVTVTLLLLPHLLDGSSWGLGLPAASLAFLLVTIRKGNLFGERTGPACRRAAERIHEILDVPCVVMGHAHRRETVVRKSPGGRQGTYINAGSFSESVLDDPHGRPACVVLRRDLSLRNGVPCGKSGGSPGATR